MRAAQAQDPYPGPYRRAAQPRGRDRHDGDKTSTRSNTEDRK